MPPRRQRIEDEELAGGQAASRERVSKRSRRDSAEVSSAFGDNSLDSDVSDAENEVEEEEEDDVAGYSHIEKVEMDNFMGLNKYSIHLKRNINLISGANGSGKSTVLCAISIALGGDARVTERAAKFEEMIGTHSDKAEIKVHIRMNDAETRQKYGEKLVVERKISRAGAVFKLVRIDGDKRTVLPSKKADLLNICACLNYQVSPLNPVQILHQSVAKSFFAKGSDKKYYDFFFRCTRLEQFQSEVVAIQEIRSSIGQALNKEEESLKIYMDTEYFEAKKDYDAQQELREMTLQQAELCKVYAWALVEESEAEVASCEKEVKKADKALKNANTALTEETQRQNDRDSRKLAVGDEVQRLRDKSEKIRLRQVDADGEEKAAKNKHRALVEQLNQENRAIQTERKKIAEIEERIHEMRHKPEQGEDQPTVADLVAKLEILKKHLKEKDDMKRNQMESVGNLREQIEHLQTTIEDSQRQIREATDKMQSLRRKDSDQAAVYRLGEHVCKIKEALEAAQGQFRGNFPVGPIGAFIRVKDNKWGKAVADCIGASSNVWLVKGRAEQDICMNILKSAANRGHLLHGQLSSFKCVYANPDDFTPARSQSQNPNVLDVVDITHPDEHFKRLIRNYLVDHFKVNEVHLCEDYSQAMAHIRRNPERVQLHNGVNITLRQQCYNIKDSRKHTKKGEAETSFPVTARNLFGCNMEEEVLAIERELHETNQDLSKANEEKMQLDNSKREAEANLKVIMADCKKLSAQIVSTKTQLEEAHSREEEIDTSPYEQEIASMERAISDKERKKGEIESALCDAKVQVEEAQKVRQGLVREAKDMQETLQAKHAELQTVGDSEDEYRNTIKSLQDLIKKREGDLNSKNQNLEKANSVLQQHLEDAREFQPRVQVNSSKAELEKELKSISKVIKSKEQEMGKVEAVELRWSRAEINRRKKEADLTELNFLFKDYSISVKLRVMTFKKMRMRKGAIIDKYFQTYLQNRGFLGNLLIDHKAKTLSPVVITEKRSEGGASKGEAVPVHQLSGGERSYSMLSFIMALSTESSSPLLALDEFDVFMDEHNRSLGLDMLIKSLRERVEMQSIIISPQSMRQVQDAPDVHKIVMREPDRTQRVLDA